MAKIALITGITGQDGSYLAELLLEKGYEVHGIVRRSSVETTERINHILDKLHLHDGDLSDSSSIIRIVNETKPDEIYNLAAQSHVGTSFDAAEYTGDVDALGVLRILEAVRMLGLEKKHVFTRHRRLNYMARLKNALKMKKLRFIHTVLMPLLNNTVFGL